MKRGRDSDDKKDSKRRQTLASYLEQHVFHTPAEMTAEQRIREAMQPRTRVQFGNDEIDITREADHRAFEGYVQRQAQAAADVVKAQQELKKIEKAQKEQRKIEKAIRSGHPERLLNLHQQNPDFLNQTQSFKQKIVEPNMSNQTNIPRNIAENMADQASERAQEIGTTINNEQDLNKRIEELNRQSPGLGTKVGEITRQLMKWGVIIGTAYTIADSFMQDPAAHIHNLLLAANIAFGVVGGIITSVASWIKSYKDRASREKLVREQLEDQRRKEQRDYELELLKREDKKQKEDEATSRDMLYDLIKKQLEILAQQKQIKVLKQQESEIAVNQMKKHLEQLTQQRNAAKPQQRRKIEEDIEELNEKIEEASEILGKATTEVQHLNNAEMILVKYITKLIKREDVDVDELYEVLNDINPLTGMGQIRKRYK